MSRKHRPRKVKMSQVQWQEEQDYNRDDSAWIEAMRADNEDPQQFVDECEAHGEVFDIRTEHCTKCPVFVPKTREELILEGHLPAEDDLPF